MRILVLSWEYTPNVVGGMGKHVAELIPLLGGLPGQDGPVYVDLITTRFAGGEEAERIDDYTTIYRVDVPAVYPLDLYNSVVASNGPLVAEARRLAGIHDYDLIHVHDWLVGDAGVILKHEWRVPLVVTIHATERGRHQGYLSAPISFQIHHMEWQICFEAWRVIVCSRAMVQELHDFFDLPVDKVDVIPNGVNPQELHISPAVELPMIRELYALNGERLLFFVGRITFEKGLQVLFRAMPEILQRYPDTRLLVAGKNSREMLPAAYQLGIADAVSILGYVTDQDRDRIYQVVDAAVFPSLYEPFGIVALEAMALGCNVIASDVGGLSEVVEHERTGLTVFPNDPASIVWAVDRLFTDPESARQRRECARHEVTHRYNWHSIARRTVALYEGILQERQAVPW